MPQGRQRCDLRIGEVEGGVELGVADRCELIDARDGEARRHVASREHVLEALVAEGRAARKRKRNGRGGCIKVGENDGDAARRAAFVARMRPCVEEELGKMGRLLDEVQRSIPAALGEVERLRREDGKSKQGRGLEVGEGKKGWW